MNTLLNKYYLDTYNKNKIYFVYNTNTGTKDFSKIGSNPEGVEKYYHLKNNIFDIYTTGLAYLSQDPENNLIKDYIESNLIEKIVEQIPKNFQINFIHYDPLEIKHPGKKNLLDYENKFGISKFVKDKFDENNIEKKNYHLVIDFGHVYNHPNENFVIQSTEGSSPGKKEKIKVLRTGFIQDIYPKFVAKLKLVDIDKDIQITTYIDKIKKLKGYKDFYYEPLYYITKYIFNKAKNELIYDLSKKYNMPNQKDQTIRNQYFTLVDEIIKKNLGEEESKFKKTMIRNIFNLIWTSNITEEYLIQLIKFEFKKSFFI